MEAQQVKSIIERALVSFSGTTTSAGNVGGTTLVCSALTALPDFDGQQVIVAEGAYRGQVRDIDGVTTGGTVTVYPAFSGQIVSGINFHIMTGLPVLAEIADIEGAGFATGTDSLAVLSAEIAKTPKSDAAVSWNATALGDINAQVDNALDTAIPGSPTADSINERIKTLDEAYTAARAVYLDELAAANLPADIDTLIAQLAGAGITTFPAAAAAGDGISLAEVVRYIQETVLGYEGATALSAKLTATRAGYLDELAAANIPADTDPKVMGRAQIFEKSITSAANAGDVTVATITTQACQIESVVIHADAAQTGDMTSCGIFGGTDKVVTFIAAADAIQANLDAADKQVAWEGIARLAAAKTIVISLAGTGVTVVDLTIVIKYRACTSGGYLA